MAGCTRRTMTELKGYSTHRSDRFRHRAFFRVLTLIAFVLTGGSIAADDRTDSEFLKSFTMWLEVRNQHRTQIEIKPLCLFILVEDDGGDELRERQHLYVRLIPDDSDDTDPYRIKAGATKHYHIDAPDLSDYVALLHRGVSQISFVLQRADRQGFPLSDGLPFRRDFLRRTVRVTVL